MSSVAPELPESKSGRRELAACDHFVQFYDQDAHLVDSVTQFMREGLYHGDAAIIIATAEHRTAIDRELQASGIDGAKHRLFSLDAAETLSRFMVNGEPNPKKFFKVVGGLVAEVSAKSKGIRAFGEMVAILWAEGNRKAALQLEELWNELGRAHSFTLFCAYPRSAFKGACANEPWLKVCKTHSRVIA